MTEYLTTTQSALAPSSPITEWHAHLDLQVRAGQMAKDTATTYRQGMRKLTEWASQQETWDRRLILEWVATLKAEGKAVKTVSIWLTGARAFFQWMLSEGRIVADPTAGIKAGLGMNISPHWLRHAHATEALENGAPLHLLKESLGHRSIATTAKYLHTRPMESSSSYLRKKV